MLGRTEMFSVVTLTPSPDSSAAAMTASVALAATPQAALTLGRVTVTSS